MLDKVKDFVLYKFGGWTEEEKIAHQKKTAENRKPCSCHMCRNPRHSGFHKGKSKLTMQERRLGGDDE